MSGLVRLAAFCNFETLFAHSGYVPRTLSLTSRVPARTLGPRGVFLFQLLPAFLGLFYFRFGALSEPP